MTTIVPPTPIADFASNEDIRSMLSDKPVEPAKPAAEPKLETSEKPVEGEKPAGENQQAATEPADKKSEPVEEPLPEGVQKRIVQEAEKQARIQSEIDRAVSARKAKEAELAKLQEGAKGSEPVKTPEASTKSKRPEASEPGHENETWDQYEARRDEWVKGEALREFEERTEAREAERASKERWDGAVKEHGAEFPSLMEAVRKVAPEGLQVAISQMDQWSQVAVHLAKNPAQLAELAGVFQQSPYKAIATLGRIEAALAKPEPKTQAAEAPLPKPIEKVGGNAAVSGDSLQDTLEKGSMTQVRATVEKLRKK